MEEPTNGELGRQITALATSTKEGIEGVHQRLDILNGKTAKNEAFRLKNEEFIDDLKKEKKQTYNRYVDLTWKIALAMVLLVFGWGEFKGLL